MQPRWPPLRVGEIREGLAESESRRVTAVQDLGEPLDLGITQIDTSYDTFVLLPAQPLDSRAVEDLDIPTASRFDHASGFGLSNHPGSELSKLTEQIGLLILTQTEPLA